jgi:hypothetical protein
MVTYKGYDRETDNRIQQAVGYEFEGGGYSFPDDERDLGWYFTDKTLAEKTANRIKSLGIPGVRCTVNALSK